MANIGCKLTDEDIKLAVMYVNRLIENNEYNNANDLIRDVFNSLVGKSTISKALGVTAFVPKIVSYLNTINKATDELATSVSELRTKIDPSVDGWLDNLKSELDIQSDLETSDFDFTAIAESIGRNTNVPSEISKDLKPAKPSVEIGKFYNVDGVMMRCKSISGDVYTMEYFNGKNTVEAKYNQSVLSTLNPTLMPTIDNGVYVVSVIKGNDMRDVALTVVDNKITNAVYNNGDVEDNTMSMWYYLTNQRGGIVRYYNDVNIDPFDGNQNEAVLKSVFSNTQQSNKPIIVNGEEIVGIALVKNNAGDKTYSYLIKKGDTVNVGDYVKSSYNYLKVYAVRNNINGYTVSTSERTYNLNELTIGEFVKKDDVEESIAQQYERLNAKSTLNLSDNDTVKKITKKLTIRDNKMSIDGNEVLLYKDGGDMYFVYPDGSRVMFDADGNIVTNGGNSYVFGTSPNNLSSGFVTLDEKREPLLEVLKVIEKVVNGETKQVVLHKFTGLKHITGKNDVKSNITGVRGIIGKNGETLIWVTINGTEFKIHSDGRLRAVYSEDYPPALYLNGDVLYESKTNKEVGNIETEQSKVIDYLYNKDYCAFGVPDGNGGLEYTSTYKFTVDNTINATQQSEDVIESKKEESQRSDEVNDVSEDNINNDQNDILNTASDLFNTQTKQIREVELTSKQQQDEALEWFNQLGFVKDGKLSLKIEEGVSPYGDDVVATWTNRLITLYYGSDNTSLYHEAFHELFNMYLTPEQCVDLYNELRSRDGKFTNHNGVEVSYKNATDIDLEEKMSEEFRTYMLTGKMIDSRSKLQKFFDKIREILSKIFKRFNTKQQLHATIKNTFENLKKRDLTPYEKNYNAMNSSNMVRTQTILQKNSYIEKDKLDSYKIGNKTLKSYALDMVVNAYNQRAEVNGKKKISRKSIRGIEDQLLSSAWSTIRDDVAKFIEDATNGEVTTSDDKTLYLKKNGEVATEISQDDIEAPEVAKNVNDGFGLNAQYTRDVNQFLTSLYVGYMKSKMEKDNLSFLQFRNLMATEKYQQDFFSWCKREIENMLDNGNVPTEYRDVFNFVKDNFGNTVDIKSNLVESNGVVYGVIGYFMKHNKILFSKTVAAEEIRGDISDESQTEFVAALMDWNRSGDETRLADLLKDEVKIIVSTIDKFSPVIDNGGFVEENGSFKLELQKNKFNGFSKSLDEYMNELETPRAIMNKIQELVKDTPPFESFIKKFRDAVITGEEIFDMLNGSKSGDNYTDKELLEVYNRLGAISDDELENKKFDNPYKAAMWRMFYQSFNNARVPGKLVRIEIDYGRTDAVGNFNIRESVIDGSAADNDAANVLDSWFKDDMYKNFNKDIFTDKVDSSIDDRLEGFAKTVANFNLGTDGFKFYHNNDVMLIDSSELPKAKKIPKDLINWASKNRFYKLALVKSSDDKIYVDKKQSTYKAVLITKDNNKIVSTNIYGDVTLIFDIDSNGNSILALPMEFDSDTPYTTDKSFIASYINNGIKTTGNYLGRGIDTRAVCGMLLLNGVSMDTSDDFNMYLYKREGVSGYEYFDSDNVSHIKNWPYHLETACGTYANKGTQKEQRAVNARIKMLNALGLYPHRTREFEKYIDDESTRYEVQSVLENLFDKAMSENPIETSLRDVFADGTQANYMMKNIVDMEKKYINNMASFSQRTGDNTNFFENTLNNTMSVLVNTINDILDKCTTKDNRGYILNKTAALEMIKQSPNISWFNINRNPMLKHSIIYRVLFTEDDGTFGKRDKNDNVLQGLNTTEETKRVEPEYVRLPEGFRLELSKLSGTEVIENENYLVGSNAYQSDELTRYSNDILLAVDGIFSPIQHSDKKSVWALGINRGFNTTKNRSKSYIDLSYCYYDKNSDTYDRMTDILLDKAIGEVEYIVNTVQRYNEGRIGKADYRTIRKMIDKDGNINFESSIVYDIISRSNSNLADKLFSSIQEFIDENPNGSVKQLRDKISESINDITKSLESYFESEVKKLMADYGDFYLGTNKIKQITHKIDRDNITIDDLRKTLMRHYFLNNFVHAMEMCTLMYGNLLNYKPVDFVKRVGAFGSTGSLTDSSQFAASEVSDELSKAVDEKTPATYMQSIAHEIYGDSTAEEAFIKHNNEIQSSLAWSDKMKTLVVSDIKRKHGSFYATEYARILTPGFDKMSDEEKDKVVESLYGNGYDEADAFAVISFDKYRQYLKFENKWTAEHEDVYKKIIRGESVNPLLVNKLFMPIKAQYIGAMNSSIDNVAFHKYQLFPLVPTIYKNGSLMDNLHKKMLREGISYVTFKSGSKVADVTDHKGEIQTLTDDGGNIRSNLGYNIAGEVKIENHDNAINIPFDNSTVAVNDYYIGNLGVLFNYGGVTYFAKLNQETGEFENAIRATRNTRVDDYTTEIFTPFLKDQLVIHDEFENEIVLPTQMRKLLISNFFNEGVPVDYKGKKKWNSLTEDEKLDASPMYRKTVNYVNALRDLRNYKKNELLKKLCVIENNAPKVDANGNYMFDKSKISKWINELIENEELPDEFKRFFKLNSNGDFDFDIRSSLNLSILEKAIVSKLDKEVTQFRVYGETLIQAPNTLFENRVQFTQSKKDLRKVGKYAFPKNPTNGLRFYELDKDGRVVSMKVKVPLSGKFRCLLELNDVVSDSDVVAGNKSKLEKLNELLQNEEWFAKHKDMLTMISVRIPTQGHNSIEMMEIFEFLPPEGPNSIILPSEIVVKSGGDYDIDKMPIMMPHISKIYTTETVGGIDVIRYDISADKSLDKKTIKQSLQLANSKLRNDVDMIVKDTLNKTLNTENVNVLFDALDNIKKLELQRSQLLDTYRDDMSKEERAKFAEDKNDIEEQIGSARSDIVKLCDELVMMLPKSSLKSDIISVISDYLLTTGNIYASEAWRGILKEAKKSDAFKGEDDETIFDEKLVSSQRFGTINLRGMRDINTNNRKKLDEILLRIATEVINGTYGIVNVDKKLVDTVITDRFDIESNIKLLNDFEGNILENKLHETILDILSDNSTFKTLITPNSTNVYDYVKSVKSPKDKLQKRPADLVNPRLNNQERLKFVAGKESLGIAAVDNTTSVIFNQIGLTTSPVIFKEDKDGSWVGSNIKVHIGFKHNIAKNGGISLSKISDATNSDEMIHNIQNKINQIINGFVDVAKDPWVKNIGGDKTRTPILLFMLQAGVSVEDAVSLLTNDKVREYCEELERNRNDVTTDESTSKFDIFKKIFKNSALGSDEIKSSKVEAGKKDYLKFRVDRYSLALALGDIGFNSNAKLNLSVSGVTNLYNTNNEKIELTSDELAVLEFINIKYMADDLTDIKIRISQDTTINDTATDIDLLTQDNKSYYFDLDTIDVSNTPVGPFNDKGFISGVMNALYKRDNMYSRIHNWVINNRMMIKNLGLGTVGEVEHMLINTYNMMMYQRSLKGVSDIDVSKLFEAFITHDYPTDGNISSIDEYSLYVKNRDSVDNKDIPPFIKNVLYHRYIGNGINSEEAKENVSKHAMEYMALFNIYNHDFLFKSEFSFAKMFEYLKNRCPKLQSMSMFNLLRYTNTGGNNLLVLNSSELEDIDAIRADITNLKNEEYIKNNLVGGVKESDRQSVINDILFFANNIEKFAMMQSDNSVEGVFGISKLGDDVERAELISSQNPIDVEEVFYNMLSTQSNKVAKYFDGYIRVGYRDGVNYVEINGVKYDNRNNECLKKICGINDEFKSKHIDFSSGVDSQLAQISSSINKYKLSPYRYFDLYDVAYSNNGNDYIYVDGIFYERNEEGNVKQLKEIPDELLSMLPRSGVVVNKYASKYAKQTGAIDTTKYNNTSGVTYANPFKYDENLKSFMRHYNLSLSNVESISAYEKFVRGENRIIVRFTDNNKVAHYVEFNTQYNSIKEVDENGYKINQPQIAPVQKSVFVTKLSGWQYALTEQIATGVLRGRDIVTDTNKIDSHTEYTNENPSSAMILMKYINNPNLLVSLNGNNTIKVAGVTFDVDLSSEYRPRTIVNAEMSDVTLAFAYNFETAGEKLTEEYSRNYHGFDLSKSSGISNSDIELIAGYAKNGKLIINVAGNALDTIVKNKSSQEVVDKRVLDILTKIKDYCDSNQISLVIRSGGQTGADESGIKAAIRLGVPAICYAPRGWRFKPQTIVNGENKYYNTYDEVAFKKRFEGIVSPKGTSTIVDDTKDNTVETISYGDDILFVPEPTSIDYRDGFTAIRLSEYKSTDACLLNITSVLQNGGKVIVYNDLTGESDVNVQDVCNFLATYNGDGNFESINSVSLPKVNSKLVNETINNCK